MKKTPLALMLATLLCAGPALAAEDQAAAETPAEPVTIATINGKPYGLDLFRIFYTERVQQSGGQNTPELQERAFNEFLNLAVASQEADKLGLADDPEVKAATQLQNMVIMSSAALQTMAQQANPTDEELQEAYKRFAEQAKRTEYKARHILVDDQAKAEALIKKLDESKGKGFAEMAKENSLGPTAEKGGDLGWFDAGQMVQPFADAVSKLKPGSYTEQPVQTQFGWHIIELEETRIAEPPSFEDAKAQLETTVRREKVAEALGKLRVDAKVELNQDVVKLKEDAKADDAKATDGKAADDAAEKK